MHGAPLQCIEGSSFCFSCRHVLIAADSRFKHYKTLLNDNIVRAATGSYHLIKHSTEHLRLKPAMISGPRDVRATYGEILARLGILTAVCLVRAALSTSIARIRVIRDPTTPRKGAEQNGYFARHRSAFCRAISIDAISAFRMSARTSGSIVFARYEMHCCYSGDG